jgi:site-specific DNA-methyltransferase (adenine-specific)
MTLTREDCMVMMGRYPDKYFDLAITDPPYGIGKDWKKRRKGNRYAETTYKNDSKPGKGYFDELFRVSKNQIIWGYNYFTDILGPTNYLIVWDKMSSNNKVIHFSKCEIAYASIKIPINIFYIRWDGYKMGAETGQGKIHPHQKPVLLYEKFLLEYAKRGDKILDTHMGSGSIAVACHNLGFDLTACEIDETYFNVALERIKKHTAQHELIPIEEQISVENCLPLFEGVGNA